MDNTNKDACTDCNSFDCSGDCDTAREWNAWERVQQDMQIWEPINADAILESLERAKYVIEGDDFRAGPIDGLQGGIADLEKLQSLLAAAIPVFKSALERVKAGMQR